jgi:hypothetical protein
VEKARQAGALFGGKRQTGKRKAPGAPLFRHRKVTGKEEREGERGERDFFFGFPRGEPERPKGPREQAARLRTKPPEGSEHGYSSGGKPLERRRKAGRSSWKAPERRDRVERLG